MQYIHNVAIFCNDGIRAGVDPFSVNHAAFVIPHGRDPAVFNKKALHIVIRDPAIAGNDLFHCRNAFFILAEDIVRGDEIVEG